MQQIYERFAAIVTRYWWAVLLTWVVGAVVIGRLAPDWDEVTLDGDLAYLPAQMTSTRGAELLHQAFPQNRAKSQMVLVAERTDGALGPADFQVVDQLARHFRRQSQLLAGQGLVSAETPSPIVEVWSRDDEIVGNKLVSPLSDQGQAALVLLLLDTEFMATANIPLLSSVKEHLEQIRQQPNFPPGLKLGISGSAAIGADTMASAQESIQNTELTTVILVVLILLAVYRAPLLVFVVLTTMVVSVAVAVDVVAMLTQVEWLDFKIFKTTKIFVIVILFGAGTDYCLFLISRYREELQKGAERGEAVTRSLAGVSDALAGSALTTIFGLAMMAFADFGKFRYSGPAIALCLMVALIACVTLTPAMLRAAGPAVFWPFGTPRRQPEEGAAGDSDSADNYDRQLFAGFWRWVADVIIRRPGLVLVTSVVIMAPLAVAGWDVKINYDLLSDLSPDRASVQGTAVLERHFAAGDIGPVTVLVHDESVDFGSDQGRRMIAELTREMSGWPGVDKVRSLTQPTGDPVRFQGLTARGIQQRTLAVHPRTRATFLTSEPELQGSVTRFDVIFDEDPFALESIDLLTNIEERLGLLAANSDSEWAGATFDFVGTTSGIRDLRAVTTSDRSLIQRLVVLAVLGVLILILRRPVICVYLICSVIFSFLVTIGATELLAQWWYGESFGGLDWKVPLFLFVILIAVGEDYNIYLTTRIFEEQKRLGPMNGLREAVIRTGGIITSCGIIMAGSFISMTTGTLRAIVLLGFALALGVILDTFIVRPILVPAFMALLIRRQQRLEAAAEARALALEESGQGAPGKSRRPGRRATTATEVTPQEAAGR